MDKIDYLKPAKNEYYVIFLSVEAFINRIKHYLVIYSATDKSKIIPFKIKVSKGETLFEAAKKAITDMFGLEKIYIIQILEESCVIGSAPTYLANITINFNNIKPKSYPGHILEWKSYEEAKDQNIMIPLKPKSLLCETVFYPTEPFCQIINPEIISEVLGIRWEHEKPDEYSQPFEDSWYEKSYRYFFSNPDINIVYYQDEPNRISIVHDYFLATLQNITKITCNDLGKSILFESKIHNKYLRLYIDSKGYTHMY